MSADIVISYARADKERILPWVERLRAAGVSVWIDEGGIVGGRRWREQIAQAIAECRAMVLMVSARSEKSEQVGNEVDLAADERRPILPLMLESAAIPYAWRYALAGRQQIRLYEGDPFPAILRALEEWGVLANLPQTEQTVPKPKEPLVPTANIPASDTLFHLAYIPEEEPDASAPIIVLPSPPKTIFNPADGIEMLYIPPGEFLMGTTGEEVEALQKQFPDWKSEWFYDEKPQRKVFLDGYYIAKTPVTVAQYRAFCKATKREMPELSEWSKDDHPIVKVTWEDAAAYCEWAGVRLPTEAEWEKAARGTDRRQWPWGSEWDSKKCRCSMNAFGDSGGTAPVGSYPEGASHYGVLDMAGNVWEWCADWYGPYDPKKTRNPAGPKGGSVRVLRGGSWDYCYPEVFRVVFRTDDYDQHGQFDDRGFRCARTS